MSRIIYHSPFSDFLLLSSGSALTACTRVTDAGPACADGADSVLEEDEGEIQYNFAANGRGEIVEILKATDVNTLTPIEAMQTLYDLKKKAEELE